MCILFPTHIDIVHAVVFVYLVSHHLKALDWFKRFLMNVDNQIERIIKILMTYLGREPI